MKERKIIFETVAGSKLYGTNTKKSDDDFLGIFIPNEDDILGLNNCPSEWSQNEKKSEGARNTVGDIDRKYFSLKQFLLLTAEGQSKQIEMLFSPKECWVSSSPEWELILKNRDMLISKNSISPFLGFAIAQAHKAVIKGDHLRTIESLITYFEDKKGRIKDFADKPEFLNLGLKIETFQDGVLGFEVAGRKYLLSLKVNDFLIALKSVHKEYGSRSHQAKDSKFDFKSLSHAYRLLYQCETFLKEGKLILPLPQDQVEFILKVKNQEFFPDEGFFDDLDKRIKEIKKIESPLPKSVDMKKVNQLCIQIMKMSFNISN